MLNQAFLPAFGVSNLELCLTLQQGSVQCASSVAHACSHTDYVSL